jgi:hypothetical protein
VLQKRTFKVFGLCPKASGTGSYFMRLGTGWLNRDNSINLKIDAFPKSGELQIREMDEDDLRKRDGTEHPSSSQPSPSVLPELPRPMPSPARSPSDSF